MEPKQMTKESNDTKVYIELDKDKVRDAIESKGIYEENGVSIKHWEGEKDSDYYIGNLKKSGFSYLGVLNNRLRRQNFGVNYYGNGDIYFGFFDNDIKEKHGAYFFNPKKSLDGSISSEVYYGFWKNNLKDHHGIYLWLNEDKGNTNPDNANFDAYIGDIENDSYKNGCYLSKKDKNYYVYYGGFDRNGFKNDERAFFYDNARDRVFHGKIVNDIFVNGYLVNYDTDGNIKSTFFIEFDTKEKDTLNATNILTSDEIDKNTLTKVNSDVQTFKHIILEDDYFGMVYNKTKEIRDYIDINMQKIDVLNAEDGYPKIMKMCAAYNDIKLHTKLKKEIK